MVLVVVLGVLGVIVKVIVVSLCIGEGCVDMVFFIDFEILCLVVLG